MQMWVLTAGEYTDETVLGVVRGSETDARRVAAQLTAKRLRAGEDSDMFYVAVQPTEDLTPQQIPALTGTPDSYDDY